jgi:methionyl-tRNA formyltransferase
VRIVFFGTPAFAVPSLKTLVKDGFEIAGVVTRPDRLRGRGRSTLESPPIAVVAKALGLPVLQPEQPNAPEFLKIIETLAPRAFAVVAYGHRLSDDLLRLAPDGAWNVHPSLLPRWRGPAPVHRTIAAGDRTTGICVIRLVAQLDAGPVANRQEIPVGPRETRGSLEARLAELGARLLSMTLQQVGAGTLRLEEQDDAQATYAATFKPDECRIEWNKPAVELDRLVRALSPSPGAWFEWAGERVKVLSAEPGPPAPAGAAPGLLLDRDPSGAWTVACAPGTLRLARVQPAGKGGMTMDAFAAGRRLGSGSALR